ncbi:MULTISPECIES: protein translocase subunit SecDF [unclassified Alistipes]|jgi:SecD/SecF fusion protein|uniref:protein translocase subunit SecDF n=1 Tax=unclassified Alistipes TaxID=2608932 RepID=UPI000E9CDB55|nr:MULTISPECIES: protein translocase subunit SecDF [unclassified Alistipes]MCX4282475.1 protein translocase subunit SecDF [Alistipes sp.]HBV49278.1 protein translocase subunit SecDF [Alistipes sp.]HUN14722.1 protein translocase subunit SecDF [Alistipes sp.]
MQSKGFIKLIAVLLALACVYQLSFTFKTRSVEKQAAAYAAQFPLDRQAEAEQHFLDSVQNLPVYNVGFKRFTYKECKEKELNLGLDLKGGMNVMLEVQVEDVVKALAGDSQSDPAFMQAIAEADEAMKSGDSKDYIGDFVKAYERLTNGGSLAAIFVSPDRKDISLESTNADVEKILKRETEAAIAASFNVLRSRIDHFGVTQPNIMRLPNSHRILVELPGVKEPQRVRDLLQGTASLEFWTTYNANEVLPSLMTADKYLRSALAEAAAGGESVKAEVVEKQKSAGEAGDLISEIGETAETAPAASERFDRAQNPLFAVLDPSFAGGAAVGAAYKADMAAVEAYLSDPKVREFFPADIEFKWGVKGDDRIDGRYYLYAIRVATSDGRAPLDGSVITEAREQYAERGASAVVSMTMNAEGAQEWSRLTGENIGKCIAIVLDGYVYSAPNVRTKIDKGSSEISGDFTIQEAQDLANVLSSGKVPAPAKIIQDTVVGPSLGQESINAGMLSFLIAFVLVLLYMGLFYKTAGWMSDIALLTNVFLLMGILVSFGAVLTLPGIAGIVLTMGMAVDANVIIYERIKEELRGGKSLSLAIKDGFSKAYSAIIDGNLTTIITGIVLFIFGNGPVQGFATTLIIGIITSFLCAVFITRLLIEWIVAKWGHISFSRRWSENFLNNTHVDFIAKRKIAYIVTAVLILLSCVSFAVRGLNLGAEFTGGRAYVVRFDKAVSAEEVRGRVEQAFAAQADADAASVSSEVKQYGNENQMRIVTQYRFDDTSDEATAEVERIIYDAVAPLYSYDITFEQFRNTQTDVNGILNADKIGPSIAKDMTWNAIYSVLFSLIAIGLYITFRFKRWQWATGATLALAVNALFIIGLFSMFYGLMPFNLEVNQAFIAAILTIIGYAINDTVVVFDRIREFLGLYPKRTLRENVNNAINSTLSRTINTSGTTIVTLLAIFFFGGETIRGFIFALTVGVVVGTAATIFIATPVAYDLMTRSDRKKEEK